MTGLAEKGQALVARSEEKRGSWSPRADSWHYHLYTAHYARVGKPMPARHGRCDYFHIVFAERAYRLRWWFAGVGIALLVGAVTWLALLFTTGVLAFGVIFGAVAYVALSFFTIDYVIDKLAGKKADEGLGELNPLVRGLAILVTLPIVAGGVALGAAFLALGEILSGIKDSRAFYWFFNARPFKGRLKKVEPWHVLISLGAVAVLVLVQLGPHALAIDIATAIFVAAVVLLLWLMVLAEKSTKRHEAEQKQELELFKQWALDQVLHRMFAFQHPEWVKDGVADERRYTAWLGRYEKYFQKWYGVPMVPEYLKYVAGDLESCSNSRRYRRMFGESVYDTSERLSDVATYQKSMPVKRPNWFMRLMRGIGDFFRLIGGWLHSFKNGVCPVVELPQPEPEATK